MASPDETQATPGSTPMEMKLNLLPSTRPDTVPLELLTKTPPENVLVAVVPWNCPDGASVADTVVICVTACTNVAVAERICPEVLLLG